MKAAHQVLAVSPQGPITVVLPIHNQASELPRFLRKLARVMDAQNDPYRIVVVDNGSTDQTARVAAELGRRFPVTVVSHSSKRGEGTALRTGLMEAIPHGGIVVTMDPERNHDPALISRMLERLESGYDVVIASRFNREGLESGVQNHRQFLRRTAHTVLRSITRVKGARDYTSGFQLYRADVLRSVLAKYGKDAFLRESDFASRFEILLKATSQGAKVVEVPLLAQYDQTRLPRPRPIWPTIRRYGAVLRRYRHASGTHHRSEQLHRILSFFVALVGVIVTAPLMIVVASAVRLTSRGPVFFYQTRVGVDRRRSDEPRVSCQRNQNVGGRPFKILKFRTMTHCPEANKKQVWASPNDPRVTKVGRILRKFRLDELPQLFNVLFGTMNVVGPRPEQPKIFEDLRSNIDGYGTRQQVPPGITGWAQVKSSYDQTLDDVRRKVEFDLEYLKRRSLLEDMKIMLQTIPVILLQRGAW